MKNEKKVGIITYHAAYNFGSVLQAYATLSCIEALGFNTLMIDYRTKSQSVWYGDDRSLMRGWRQWMYNYGFKFIRRARKIRIEKFESFISTYLNLTPKRYESYNELCVDKTLGFDILVSGSDQIWNSSCSEFMNEPPESIKPYFLKFGNPGKKIAYASSFGDQSFNYIKRNSQHLKDFDYLSTREPINQKFMEKALNCRVEIVADPTWLLNKEQWIQSLNLYVPSTNKPYAFVYFLGINRKDVFPWLAAIKQFAEEKQLDVYLISPLNFNNEKGILHLYDAGPIDFLSYLWNASFVFTNTFHGTIFSLNFEKPFFCIQASPASRQGQMLAKCDMEDRIINDPSEIIQYANVICSFDKSSKVIDAFRQDSLRYLTNALYN